MRKLCILIVLLFPIVGAIAQRSNQIANMVEDAVIEYYDTLSTHQNYRLQKYRRGELRDTNIYLYLNCVDVRLFIENMQHHDKMPSNIFFHTKGKYQFIKKESTPSSRGWSFCHSPNTSKTRSIEVIKISYVDLLEDTLAIHLTHCYFSKGMEKMNGRYSTISNWAISGGATWKYIFSEERKQWICVEKIFREI